MINNWTHLEDVLETVVRCRWYTQHAEVTEEDGEWLDSDPHPVVHMLKQE